MEYELYEHVTQHMDNELELVDEYSVSLPRSTQRPTRWRSSGDASASPS